jgi:hypothetical protein
MKTKATAAGGMAYRHGIRRHGGIEVIKAAKRRGSVERKSAAAWRQWRSESGMASAWA